MTKTAEEEREELIAGLAHPLIIGFLEDKIDFLSVSEYLYDEGFEDDDNLLKDVYNEVNDTLDDLLQRYLDE